MLIKRFFRNRAKIINICTAAASTSSRCETRTKCKVGDKAVSMRRISMDDVMQFAHLSGDVNPVHLPASGEMAVVHGALLNGMVSGVIGTQLPGAGTLVVTQTLHFPNKCYVGEKVHINVEVTDVRKIISLKFACTVDKCAKTDDGNKCVLHGEARVIIR